jgi:hypothetical protein
VEERSSSPSLSKERATSSTLEAPIPATAQSRLEPRNPGHASPRSAGACCGTRGEPCGAGSAETIGAGRFAGSWRRSGGLRFLVHLCPRSGSFPNQQRYRRGPKGAGGSAEDYRNPEEWERRPYLRDPANPAGNLEARRGLNPQEELSKALMRAWGKLRGP